MTTRATQKPQLYVHSPFRGVITFHFEKWINALPAQWHDELASLVAGCLTQDELGVVGDWIEEHGGLRSEAHTLNVR